MTLLITGGTGFVMSVLARHWLEVEPRARLVILDAAAPDAAAVRYFAPVAERISFVVADITQPSRWREALASHVITHVVHGATITPISRGTAREARREPETDDPARIVDVNLMGTVALLDWARGVSGLKRFIYVSSGAVYKHHGPDRPGEPLPEDGRSVGTRAGPDPIRAGWLPSSGAFFTTAMPTTMTFLTGCVSGMPCNSSFRIHLIATIAACSAAVISIREKNFSAIARMPSTGSTGVVARAAPA